MAEVDPAFIGVLGDLEGMTRPGLFTLEKMCGILKQDCDEEHPFFLQAGDFVSQRYDSRGGIAYLYAVSQLLQYHSARLDFIDGNHDDHNALLKLAQDCERAGIPPPYPVAPGIRWMPRGYRWIWHGRTWLALGGAASVNRSMLTEGVDWWPEEMITLQQAADVSAGGHADVMFTHDAPEGVPIRYPFPPDFWDKADIASSSGHRRRLAGVVSSIRPSYLIHGHHNTGRAQWQELQFPHGPLRVASLNGPGAPGNAGILNLADMRWEWAD